MKALSRKTNRRVNKTLHMILLIVLAIIFIFPLVFMVISSFKGNEYQIIGDMSSIKAIIPYGEINFQNYIDLFKRMDFFKFFMNSVIVTLSAVTIGIFVNSMIAFALARLEFKGKNLILSLMIALIIVPIEAIIIPMFLEANAMGLVDTYTVQVLPFVADAFIIFLFYSAFMDIPKDFDEAARIDGASYFKIYRMIIMPLSKPTIATAFILNFLGRWGDVLWPTLVTRGEAVRPLPLAMQMLFTQQNKLWGDIFAFTTLATLPVLILFLMFQKKFIESVAASGVKE